MIPFVVAQGAPRLEDSVTYEIDRYYDWGHTRHERWAYDESEFDTAYAHYLRLLSEDDDGSRTFFTTQYSDSEMSEPTTQPMPLGEIPF